MAKPKTRTTKKQGQDIPLANIPERARRAHTIEFKEQVAARVIAGESPNAVAEELGLARSMVTKWAQLKREGKPLAIHGGARVVKDHDPTAASLRAVLEKAARARDERLDVAAAIVEADGTGSTRDVQDMAKKIRALKRQP